MFRTEDCQRVFSFWLMLFTVAVGVEGHWRCYLRVHEAEWKAHGDGEEPHEDDLEGNSPPGFIASELHRVP